MPAGVEAYVEVESAEQRNAQEPFETCLKVLPECPPAAVTPERDVLMPVDPVPKHR